MKTELQQLLQQILVEMGVTDIVPEVTISDDPAHGEYSTNIAMRVAKQLGKSPMDVALQVVEKLRAQSSELKAAASDQKIGKRDHLISPRSPLFSLLQAIERVEAVPPGFINFWLTEAKLINQIGEVLKEKESFGKTQKGKGSDPGISKGLTPVLVGKRVMVEFAHPNTHKAFHIGHLRNIATGESIVRLLKSQGIEVIRANYQGDVGMHIAKALYALMEIPSIKSQIPNIRKQEIHQKVEFLGKAYAEGNKAFEESRDAKQRIGEINIKIYAKDPSVFPLYQETRQWSLDYFEAIYKRVGTTYDRYYFESEVFESGKKYVLEALKKGIFVESEGAIIFPGEKYGLHNRVFVTREGNATYEGKDVGLVRLQLDEYHPDLIIHVVGPEQAGYFEVLFKALEQVFPETKGREYHLIYGWVKLKHGKMSSRTGQVVLGEWLLDEAKNSIYEILDKNVSKYNTLDSRGRGNDNSSRYTTQEKDDIAEKAAVAAVKYAFLKVSTKQEIAFDLKESVSFEGDSGPYLLYTYARCKSVLRKADESGVIARSESSSDAAIPTIDRLLRRQNGLAMTMNLEERALARLIGFFPEIVASAAHDFAPNQLCSYLFSLAQAFNLFYQKHSILAGDTRHAIGNTKDKKTSSHISRVTSHVSHLRLTLTTATAQVLKNGLYLLGISTVERM